MAQADSVFRELASSDLDRIRAQAVKHNYKEGEVIFSEGDTAEYVYFIESGRVSVFVQKFTEKEEIATLGPGQ